MLKSNLSVKIKNVKIVLTDVDGTLTDGGMYYSSKGDTMKKFYVRDGMAVNILRRNGIFTVLVTKEKSDIVKKWAKKMNVKKVHEGITNKEKILPRICKEYRMKPEQIVYIGDDINDIGLMKAVGISVAPADAWKKTRQTADFVTNATGGNGVLREVTDLILENKNRI